MKYRTSIAITLVSTLMLLSSGNAHADQWVSVISIFDGLLVTLRDGRCGKYLQQNGTGIATGAVLALSG